MIDQGIPTDIDSLTELFRKARVEEPRALAAMQITHGTNDLHRYLFLRQAWAEIVSEGDDSWIDEEISHAAQRPTDPYAGIGHALRQLVDQGADASGSPSDLWS